MLTKSLTILHNASTFPCHSPQMFGRVLKLRAAAQPALSAASSAMRTSAAPLARFSFSSLSAFASHASCSSAAAPRVAVPAIARTFSTSSFLSRPLSRASPNARLVLLPVTVAAAPARSMFIQVQPTPNPRSLKFLPGREVLPTTDAVATPVASFDASNRGIAKQQSPLAYAVLLLEGVSSVMFGADFVTVTVDDGVDWMPLKPQVFAAITDAYATGQPIVAADTGAAGAASLEQPCLPGDEETVELIKEIIDMRVRPSVMEDGGDIEFIKLDADRIVWLLMKGTRIFFYIITGIWLYPLLNDYLSVRINMTASKLLRSFVLILSQDALLL